MKIWQLLKNVTFRPHYPPQLSSCTATTKVSEIFIIARWYFMQMWRLLNFNAGIFITVSFQFFLLLLAAAVPSR